MCWVAKIEVWGEFYQPLVVRSVENPAFNAMILKVPKCRDVEVAFPGCQDAAAGVFKDRYSLGQIDSKWTSY